jgi:hypothetical protein
MRSIFSFTYLDASILPTGFIDWAGTPRYDNYTLQAEYKDHGPGFNATARAQSLFDVQLTAEEYEPYSDPKKVFQFPDGRFGNYEWVDWSV